MVVLSLPCLQSIVSLSSCTPLISLTFQLSALETAEAPSCIQGRCLQEAERETSQIRNGKKETKAGTIVWDRDRGGCRQDIKKTRKGSFGDNDVLWSNGLIPDRWVLV